MNELYSGPTLDSKGYNAIRIAGKYLANMIHMTFNALRGYCSDQKTTIITFVKHQKVTPFCLNMD